MNKISYPQLIKDVADTYRDAVGSSEPVVIGELTSKLAEAMNSTGSGLDIEYKSIIYNEDNTITLIDVNDIEHTVSCIYEDGKIASVTFDDEEIKLSYNGDDLVAVGNVATDLSNVPKISQPNVKGSSSINVVYPITAENVTATAIGDHPIGISIATIESEE